ncbi:MAG TPA: ELM1/GtrOC1 family putative glycosyltransferase, partial [Arenimonas sp.]|nr:ELM1/GtrOC1 family putative glycosyltransferase [Arenimonas sp.]
AEQGGSLLVLGSRRTEPHIARLARRYWQEVPGLRWFDAGDGRNPYAGVMAWADRFVLSPDSVNMISEACATARPVFVAEPERATGRVRRFLDDLLASGRIRAQDTDLADFDATPLRETQRIAEELRTLLTF